MPVVGPRCLRVHPAPHCPVQGQALSPVGPGSVPVLPSLSLANRRNPSTVFRPTNPAYSPSSGPPQFSATLSSRHGAQGYANSSQALVQNAVDFGSSQGPSPPRFLPFVADNTVGWTSVPQRVSPPWVRAVASAERHQRWTRQSTIFGGGRCRNHRRSRLVDNAKAEEGAVTAVHSSPGRPRRRPLLLQRHVDRARPDVAHSFGTNLFSSTPPRFASTLLAHVSLQPLLRLDPRHPRLRTPLHLSHAILLPRHGISHCSTSQFGSSADRAAQIQEKLEVVVGGQLQRGRGRLVVEWAQSRSWCLRS